MNAAVLDFTLDEQGPHGIAVSSWLEPGRLALIIVDVQHYITLPQYSGTWTAGGGPEYYYDRLEKVVLPNVGRLITCFRERGAPVVYTRIASGKTDLSDVGGVTKKVLTGELFDVHGTQYHLLDGEHASQIDRRLKPESADLLISKTASGAFCSSDIDSKLRGRGLSRLVFTGGLTDACVASTVRQAYDLGYLCTVVEDACITSSAEDHGAALRSLKKFYAWVVTTDDLLFHLSSG
jgi:nicotinamidase-related amidase